MVSPHIMVVTEGRTPICSKKSDTTDTAQNFSLKLVKSVPNITPEVSKMAEIGCLIRFHQNCHNCYFSINMRTFAKAKKIIKHTHTFVTLLGLQ